MSELVVPAAALVLMVGPAGSGKTTFAQRHFPADAVLSSDDFRALVAGDAADQSATDAAFGALAEAAEDRLRQGHVCVIDATNLLRDDRGRLLDRAWAHGRPAVAIAFNLALGQCLAWNSARPGRRVPAGVVRSQHRLLARALRSLPREGVDALFVLNGVDEVASTTVSSRP